jgi:hypothetical protein
MMCHQHTILEIQEHPTNNPREMEIRPDFFGILLPTPTTPNTPAIRAAFAGTNQLNRKTLYYVMSRTILRQQLSVF